MGIRTRIYFVLMAFLFSAVNSYAANGDLVVKGDLSVGSAIKFSDSTTQNTAAPGNALVWDYTVTGSPVTSVTSPTLDGNADGGYEFEFQIVNSSGSNVFYRLYYNNDQINSNYTGDELYWTGGVVNGKTQANDAYLLHYHLSHTDRIFGRGAVDISPDGYVVSQYQAYKFGGYLELVGHRKKAPANNLTRLDVVANVPNGIGLNSRFRLWKHV